MVHIKDLQAVDAKANGANTVTVFVGETVNFSATTTPPNYTGLNFEWTFDNNDFSPGQNTSYAYQAPGQYTATCTATYQSGEAPPKSDSVTVNVKSCSVSIVGADSGDCGSTLALGSSVDPHGGIYAWSIVGPRAEFFDPPGRNGPGVKLN